MEQDGWKLRHGAALVVGNVALALGPWWVRLADSGPVAAGFWRLALAVPVLLILARVSGQALTGYPARTWWALSGAGAFFALDLASWHLGIGQTKLGNAALFGNSGSIVLMAWGLLALRLRPRMGEWLAFAAAMAGTAILMGSSLEVGTATLIGDVLCLIAGLFYAFYILLLQNERARFGAWSLLALSSLAGAPVLLVIALALGSQLIGQGLLVYALGHFRPLVIGLALLTQPAVAALAGWLAFGEVLSLTDVLGMALIAGALVLATAGARR